MSHFNWRKYCYENGLPSFFTKKEAYNHYVTHSDNKIIEQLPKNTDTISLVKEYFPLSLTDHKNLLFLCYTVPMPDVDSGSNRMIQLLRIIIDLGYNVYYLTHNGQTHNPSYIDNLYKMGVKKVLVADNKKNLYCHDYIKKLCFDDKIIFSSIIFEFYEMYCSYWDKIQYIVPNIKVIVDSVDVHWTRKLSNPNNTQQDIDKILIEKNDEKLAYSKANVVFAVTEEDKKEIIKECPGANVKIVSNIYNFIDSNYIKLNIDKKNKDLIFVGGDNHTPNTIAAQNAIRIFKQFIKDYPEFNGSKLHIVGYRDDPTILSYSNDPNIRIHHNLSQQTLDNLYELVWGALCPITWGAGIKGKVCEAILHRLPVITTETGASGLSLIDNDEAFIANDTKDTIKSIHKLFKMNYKEYQNLTNRALLKLELVTSADIAKHVIEGTLSTKPIVISIVTYNNAYLLQRCLDSILSRTTYPNYKIHITSNACKDNTPEIMDIYTKKYSHITYQYNQDNKYFIQAHNEVIDLFPHSDIVLLNEDIEILSTCWLSDLYSSVYSTGYIGCAGGKTIYPDGTLCEAGARIFNDGHGENIGRYKNPNNPEYNIAQYVGYVSGCLMYMRRDCINKYGNMDMRYYPCYYEDSDWQYNLHLNGYKTIYNPNVVAIHREGSSCGTDIDDSKGLKRFMKINRSKFLQKYSNIDLEAFNQ